MTARELTLDQVKSEIIQIIQTNPDNKGQVMDEYGESNGCVYFLDSDGNMIDRGFSGYDDEVQDPQCLATPVCLVGRWIEDFHPEFKEDPAFVNLLFKNQMIGTAYELGLDQDVRDFLGHVQGQQDNGIRWASIDLDYDPVFD